MNEVQESLHNIALTLQKIELTQKAQALDISRHIRRTDALQEHVMSLEKSHNECPALLNIKAGKTVMVWVKDSAVIIGLLVLILKTFHLV